MPGMRVKRFVVSVEVTSEFLRHATPDARTIAHDMLRAKAKEDMTGPRGGRYVPVGEPYRFEDSADGSDGWMRGMHTFAARVDGKYVRPRRSA